MARNPLEIGHHGKISRRELSAGVWRASCRFRDSDGVTRQVTATGKTGAAAERALLRALDNRTNGTSDRLTVKSKVSDLAPIWWEEFMDRERPPAANTQIRYRDILHRIVLSTAKPNDPSGRLPGIGAWRIGEVTVGRLNRFMRDVRQHHGASTARLMKAVLFGLFSVAVAHDLMEVNPVRELATVSAAPKPVRALTIEEVRRLRHDLKLWQQDGGTVGRPRSRDLLDVIDIMLATGCRIGEALAVRWSDIDLAVEHPTVTIQGTVVYVPGHGVQWQPHRKASGLAQTHTLPRFAVDMLMRRQLRQAVRAEHDVVFSAANGKLRDPNNYRKQWRTARAELGFGWVTPHTFRKSVGTVVERSNGLSAASLQLGHSSESVTSRHYVERRRVVPDLSSVLEGFGSPSD
ncbi:tyrosine-type recombinase/integrase [Zhihengliuella halotolerans]|uniref:tyrosine-type recombinase/integrase n=1 Tax=Zhihengliuella halotolerans TaxID=370736 RepID=UPI000C80B5E1|nr:tyrosine-type recombinase/integrase [Zhihengliuella halotolerans]